MLLVSHRFFSFETEGASRVKPKFTPWVELTSDYDASLADRDDLNKGNDQQSKTIRHLQTRIKLLEKSQNELYKTNNVMERENKTLKSQLEDRLNDIKTLRSERKKDKADFENKLKIKINEIEQQYVNELKNKEIQMRELERQHDDKLNIIRSMAIPINTHVAETCATPAGKGTPRRRPPTPYAESTKIDAEEESNGNEKYRMVAYEHTEVVQVKKRCQSEERLLQSFVPSPSSRQGPAVAPKRFRM